MPKASYKNAIEWIALEDDAGASYALDIAQVSGMLTVALVADLWGKDQDDVANDVIEYRTKVRKRREAREKLQGWASQQLG